MVTDSLYGGVMSLDLCKEIVFNIWRFRLRILLIDDWDVPKRYAKAYKLQFAFIYFSKKACSEI